MYRIIESDGEVKESEPRIDEEKLLRLYRDMVLSRIMDDWLIKLQRAGRVFIHAPIKGQEAAMVGSAHAIGSGDWVFPTYRELAVYIVRGVPLEEILNRWSANCRDIMKGHDLAVFGDKRYRIVPAPVPVATQIPLSVGFAYAAKLRGERIAVVTYFGDGATSKGDFHEGVNFAGVLKVPVVFICQNNQYAISVPVARQTAAESIAVKAVAYGIRGERIDGNDVLAVYTKTLQAVERARNNHEPTLLELVTYRLGPHSTADDPTRYRGVEEVEEWAKRDPIIRFRRYLEKRGLWSADADKALWEELEEVVRKAVDNMPQEPPRPEIIFEDVYAEVPWHLGEELEELLENLRD